MDPSGKKVVVVGSGNSAHDIAQDFHENGAQVTLIQRGSTYVLGQAGLPLLPENAFVDDDSCVHLT
jgi:cation diffusion facilitator CzcD-associated flavoprotein CzcO